MWKWLWGLGGAVLGGLGGLAVSVFIVFVCETTIGEPRDLGVTIMLGLGTVFGGILVGAVLGAYLGSRKGPPKS